MDPKGFLFTPFTSFPHIPIILVIETKLLFSIINSYPQDIILKVFGKKNL